MNLVWSFTTKMVGYTDTEKVLDLYRASMIRAKQFNYNIKFYGCDFSIEYLNGYYDTCVDVSDEEFILTDDLKIYVHTKEDLDCVTIDGDLILKGPLNIERLYNNDVVFEYPETSMTALHDSRKKYIGYLHILKLLRKYNIPKVIEEYKDMNDLATNVGIIKFNNHKTKNLFINKYNTFRDFYLTNIEPTEGLIGSGYVPSIVVCQYLYGCLVNYHNISVGYTKTTSEYDHFYGQWKFHPNTTKYVNNIIDENKQQKKIL